MVGSSVLYLGSKAALLPPALHLRGQYGLHQRHALLPAVAQQLLKVGKGTRLRCDV